MSADRDQKIAGNVRIETSIPWIDEKNAWIEHIKSLRAKGMMTAITSSAIISVLEDLRESQVIGTQDVKKILDCKETKALRIITEMKKATCHFHRFHFSQYMIPIQMAADTIAALLHVAGSNMANIDGNQYPFRNLQDITKPIAIKTE